jgi:hypothetical protein
MGPASGSAPVTTGSERDGSARHQGLRAVGLAVSQVAAPILKRRGGGVLVRLKTDWPAIVGEAWSRVSWPMALGRDGALRLRVVPAAALDLQHRAPLVIERINLYFGRPVATRLLFVQGPLPLASDSAAAASPRTLAAGAARALDQHLAHIPDPDLRGALARLGRAVLAADAPTADADPAAAPPGDEAK